jgi:DNA-binding MarR family transcriptional regulator
MARLLGLNPTDYKALSVLERRGPLSAGEIAEHTGLATASVTNLVDRLESKGFVRRVRGEADRRRVLVEPIPHRLNEARRRFASSRHSLARLYRLYPDEALAVLADFFARNAERLRMETIKLAADQS